MATFSSKKSQLNGNSSKSLKAQHGYEITDTWTNSVCKTGISGCSLNSNGTSPRANQQVNKWNNEPGNEGRYTSQVVKTIPAGDGARKKILIWERSNADKHSSTLDIKRHRRR
ncbi:hypothetical protein [Acinetobacter sp. Tr-809]|uniref:hypothetical protein n=1 Tax=Acinetobacter sp. Tr-809 TaxID=2608324 RepID=UPI003A4C65AD